MLPHLHGRDSSSMADQAVAVPPPPGLVLPVLPLKSARTASWTPGGRGFSAAQKAGLRFERKVHAALSENYQHRYRQSLVLRYTDADDNSGGAILDGLLQDLNGLTIIEIKAQHSPESWWQLRKKYEPIVRFIFPQQRVVLLEICRSLDAAMPYPEAYEYVEHLDNFLKKAPDGTLGVFQWRI